MKYKIYFPLLLLLTVLQLNAQNTFPANGRVGVYTNSPSATLQVRGGARIGSTTTSYVNIDSITGNLSFTGNSQYLVAGNKYAFAFAGNPNYGLYFNQTNVRYEFRNNAAAPSFYVGADDGNGVFTGGVRVGNSSSNVAGNIRWANGDFEGYNGSAWISLTGGGGNAANKNLSNLTAPTALKIDLLPNSTNTISLGSTALRYEDVHLYNLKFSNGTTQTTAFTPYAAGSGINISSNAIVNTAPDQTVVLNSGSGIAVSGTYPNFTVASTLTSSQWVNGSGSISYNGGNVGIGTETPQSRFEVNGGDAKINDLVIGKGNGLGGSLNTAFGVTVLVSNSTGSFNTAAGFAAMQLNTTGSNNTATGYGALYRNTTGGSNSAIGAGALFNNTSGRLNTAVGVNALGINTTGTSNVAFGQSALFFNSSGNNNVAIGAEALRSNSSGDNLVAVGDSALYNLNGGNGFNTAVGSKALYGATTAQEDAAFGFGSLQRTTTGSYNAAFGTSSLTNNTTGVSNTAVGTNAIGKGTTASDNTAVGTNALNNTTTGGSNTAVGRSTLNTNTTGTFNTAIGYNANVSSASLTNATAIGNGASVDASNKIRLGNTSVTSIGGQVSYTTFSDGRFKQNIKENIPGLDFIKKLKPVSYNYDVSSIDNFWNVKDDDNAEAQKAKAAQIKKRYTGFLAQDVDKAAQSLNYDFSGIDKPEDDSKSTWGLRYSDFVVPLVKAVQELSKVNDDKDALIEKQNNKIDDLEKRLARVEYLLNNQQSITATDATITTGKQTIALSGAKLEQNIPNPFNGQTTINYYLPQSISNATIHVTAADGKLIKTISLAAKGNGQLQLQTAQFAAGTYRYSLIVDGKLIDTKTLVLIK